MFDFKMFILCRVCLSKEIQVREVAPSWSQHELWEEAFITSKSFSLFDLIAQKKNCLFMLSCMLSSICKFSASLMFREDDAIVAALSTLL